MRKIKNIKIRLPRILLFTLFLAFTNMICFSQVASVQTDTTKVRQNQTESDNANQDQIKEQEQVQEQNQLKNQNQVNDQKASNAKAVKQVRSARPDMSKAKGARPNIVRPSGSNIPKGVGKPGGARRIGGR